MRIVICSACKTVALALALLLAIPVRILFTLSSLKLNTDNAFILDLLITMVSSDTFCKRLLIVNLIRLLDLLRTCSWSSVNWITDVLYFNICIVILNKISLSLIMLVLNPEILEFM
jgi:hypothetical protein